MKTDILKQPWLAQSNYIVFLLNISMPTCPQKTRKWDFKALLLVGEKIQAETGYNVTILSYKYFLKQMRSWNK